MLLDTTSWPLSVGEVEGDVRSVLVAGVASMKVSYVFSIDDIQDIKSDWERTA